MAAFNNYNLFTNERPRNLDDFATISHGILQTGPRKEFGKIFRGKLWALFITRTTIFGRTITLFEVALVNNYKVFTGARNLEHLIYNGVVVSRKVCHSSSFVLHLLSFGKCECYVVYLFSCRLLMLSLNIMWHKRCSLPVMLCVSTALSVHLRYMLQLSTHLPCC